MYQVAWGFGMTGQECGRLPWTYCSYREALIAAEHAERQLDNPACGCWVVKTEQGE